MNNLSLTNILVKIKSNNKLLINSNLLFIKKFLINSLETTIIVLLTLEFIKYNFNTIIEISPYKVVTLAFFLFILFAYIYISDSIIEELEQRGYIIYYRRSIIFITQYIWTFYLYIKYINRAKTLTKQHGKIFFSIKNIVNKTITKRTQYLKNSINNQTLTALKILHFQEMAALAEAQKNISTFFLQTTYKRIKNLNNFLKKTKNKKKLKNAKKAFISSMLLKTTTKLKNA